MTDAPTDTDKPDVLLRYDGPHGAFVIEEFRLVRDAIVRVPAAIHDRLRAEHPDHQFSVMEEAQEPDATPAAAAHAEATGVDLHDVEGSGAQGRITKADVEGAVGEAVGEPAAE